MKKILWLDDNESLLEAGVEIFREYGFDVIKSTYISETLTLLRNETFDGMLLDVRLHGKENGLELLKEIHILYPNLRVVIFTAFDDFYDQAVAMQSGASLYYAKLEKAIPVDKVKLKSFFDGLHQIFERPKAPVKEIEDNIIRQFSLFCSYSKEDIALRNKLEKHLATLQRTGIVSVWHDRKIDAGEEWESEIDVQLNKSDIILLLVSAAFMATDYIYNVEIKRAMERHERGEAKVIPILLRPCVWEDAPFAKLQFLPTKAKAVTQWTNQEEALADVALGIRRVIEKMSAPQI